MTRVLLVPDLPGERWPSMDRYATRLVAHLGPAARGLDIAVAGPIGQLTVDGAPGGRRASEREPPPAPPRWSEVARYITRYGVYPRRVRRQPADVVHILDHSYAHIVRTRPQVPSVVTVHDLFPLHTLRRRVRGVRHRLRNALLRRVLASLREARAWIVATRWLGDELRGWLERDDGVHVIPLGVDDAFLDEPPQHRNATREHLGIPRERFVVLHVGSVTGRKNIPGVLAVVDGLRERGVAVWLLQVGGTFSAEHRGEIEARGLAAMVTQVPAAAEAELRAAYRAADVLLFPSHYEGFGLPVLEAMASGIPVVTSDAGALPEVAGDAAVVVEGRDPARYLEAVERIATSPSWAGELVARGRQRAPTFRWAETARRTAEVYHSLV